MFISYIAARLASSKPKKCKYCGINDEKVQGYCSDCLKIGSPDMRAIMRKHESEYKANSSLGKIFVLITIVIAAAMVLLSL